jgi:hypothetical protein
MENQLFCLSDIIRMGHYKTFYFSHDYQLSLGQAGENLK